MQFWHRLGNTPIPTLISSGTMFSITFLQLLGYQCLGFALGFRLISKRLGLRLARSTDPAKAHRKRIAGD